MDLLPIVLIVLAVVVIVVAAFALFRKQQRSGTVLAAPDSMSDRGDGR